MSIRFLFAHHKCASRFFRQLLKELDFDVLNYTDFIDRKVTLEHMDELDLETLDARLDKYPQKNKSIISIINTTQRVLNLIDNRLGNEYLALHIVRDPRDILISAYLHHLEGHPVDNRFFYWPELESLRYRLKTLDTEEGIVEELNSITKRIFDDQLSQIPIKDQILTVKLEEFVLSRSENLRRISNFFDIQPVTEINFDNVPKGSNEVRQNSRDWQNYFTPEIKKVFQAKYSKLLIKLGYEQTEEW